MRFYLQKMRKLYIAFWTVAVMLVSAVIPVNAATALNVSQMTGHANSGLAATYEQTSSKGSASASVSGDTITGTAKGVKTLFSSAAASLKVTLSNGAALEKKLEFTASKGSTCNSLTVNGTAQSEATKEYQITLAAGSAVEIVLTTAADKSDNTFTLSNIKLYAEGLTVPVTYVASPTDPAGNSPGTYSTLGTTAEYTSDITGLTVSPASGWKFYCWKDTSGNILSYDASGFPLPDAETSVYPYFVPSDAAVFRVGFESFYYWEDAVQAAVNGSTKKIILDQDGILPGTFAKNKFGTYASYNEASGLVTYTLPQNIQFLIPYASDDTGNFTNKPPTSQEKDGYINMSMLKPAYTLTLASGAVLECNGDLNVNGRGFFDTDNNAISGSIENSYGRLVLAGSGTQLKLSATGRLFAYGYIVGSGQVEASSGSSVYEILQLRDYPGGKCITEWQGEFTSFPFSHYYAQNIESAFKINAGANCYVSIMISYNKYMSKIEQCVPYICADKGLFHLTSGYLVRKVNATYGSTTATDADRITYDIYGDVKLGNIELTIPATLVTINLDTYDYILGLNGNITMNMNSGTLSTGESAKYKIMPGGELNIGKKAKIQLDGDLYLYDVADWNAKSFYWYCPLHYVATIEKAPKRSSVGSARLKVDGILEIGANGHLFVTSNGGTSSDKVIVGTGTIINNASYTADESGNYGTLQEGAHSETFATVYNIKSIPAVGLLSGVSTSASDVDDSFGSGTYKGQSSGYWYQYTVGVAGGNVSDITGTNVATGNTTGEIARVTSGTTITFKADGYNVKNGETLLAPDESGVYKLENISSNIELTLTEKCKHANKTAHDAKAATCVEPGNSAYWICADCVKYFSDAACTTEITKDSWVIQPTGNHTGGTATCTKKATCTTCSQEYGELAAHTEVTDNAVAPTCTEPGLTEGKHCSVCEKVLTAPETVKALGHKYSSYNAFGQGLEKAFCDNNCGSEDVRVAENHGEGNVGVTAPTEANQAEATLGTGLLTQIKNKGLKLEMKSDLLNLTFDSNALGTILTNHAGKSNVTLKVEDKSTTENKNLRFDIYLSVDGVKQETSQFGTGNVTVTIPLGKLNLTDKQTVKVWYVKGATRTEMDSKVENGCVTFQTNHFSEYEVQVVDVVTTPKLDNQTGTTTPATINAPTSGTVGSVYEFTVTCEKACVVFAKDGEGNYIRLSAKAVENQNNTYSFTVTLEEGMTFVVAIKGDISLDGTVDGVDAARAALYFAQKITLDAVNVAVGDLNGDNVIDGVDAVRAALAFAQEITIAW